MLLTVVELRWSSALVWNRKEIFVDSLLNQSFQDFCSWIEKGDCFKWKMLSLWESRALLFLQLLIAVVVCHDQVRLQVSQGFRCRDS